MLGKRFRRTTSMSQLGPGNNQARPRPPSPPETFAQGIKDYSIDVCSQYEGYEDADRRHGSGDAMMGHDIDPSHIMLIDTILTETSPNREELCLQAYEDQSMGAFPLQVQTSSPVLVPYQMGLWTHHHYMGSPPHVGLGKLQHMSAEESSMCPVDFLDVCFHCKRRLTHERDIFIYRGDSAFCSEECRHRQISKDERRSRRGTNSKRGGTRTSETAVAA